MSWLLHYLTYNRAGTRIGRATWLYFGLWTLLLITNELLVHIPEIIFIGFGFLSPLILLFNRLDRSGPPIEEAEKAAKARSSTMNKIMLVIVIIVIILFIYLWITLPP